jgi:hypothetical protein
MHASAIAHMEMCIRTYLDENMHYRVVDLGSWARPTERTHRDLLTKHRVSYLGVDIVPGFNVDRVMSKPFQIPVRSCSVDLVISGRPRRPLDTSRRA